MPPIRSFAPAAHVDNFVYTGPRNGTRQQLLALILDPANWQFSNGLLDVAALSPQTSFAVGTGPHNDQYDKSTVLTAEDFAAELAAFARLI